MPPNSPAAGRPLRFGVVCPITTDLPTWRDQLSRIADAGYDTILMPDVPEWQPAPGPALAMAAAYSGLRVGTWVYASPVRPPWLTAWEAHSLSVLTGGRFEMGLGSGRPDISEQLRGLGLPDVPQADRLDHMRAVVSALTSLDGPDSHTPIVMAVAGPKAFALAAELADTVTFAMPHIESREQTMARVRHFDNSRGLELALHIPAVGASVAAFMAGPGTDPAALRAADSLAYLPDDPAAAADEIERRRDELGFTYFVIGIDVADTLARAVAQLATR